ncbi:hypothetical protein, partial [Streptomyces sp. NPDC058272]|uniref:hypothetical protein n=1 Tax=Streptomyces sp. NPDC058272 TaxID=3346415 RepID=UPI0036EF3B12
MELLPAVVDVLLSLSHGAGGGVRGCGRRRRSLFRARCGATAHEVCCARDTPSVALVKDDSTVDQY